VPCALSWVIVERVRTNRGDPRSALGYLDLGYLLSLAGLYGMFRDYLTKTDVIKNFQSIAFFAPVDPAFAAVDSGRR
jgi:hypothetical protein